ncbi:MAG: hypothetical protein C4334_00440 [Pyrinomonas sp.]
MKAHCSRGDARTRSFFPQKGAAFLHVRFGCRSFFLCCDFVVIARRERIRVASSKRFNLCYGAQTFDQEGRMRTLNSKMTVVLVLALLAAGCAQNEQTSNANANVAVSNVNANMTVAQQAQTGPDNTEITVSEENGVRTETRVFRDPNSRVEKVVVTTDRSGRRTARVYSRTGEVKELPENKVAAALEATGDALADAAGFVVDKSKEAAGAVKEGAGTAFEKTAEGAKFVGEKTVEGAKTVGSKAAEGAKTIGEKTAEGAKRAGEKTVEGAKKVGNKVKEAVTP